MMEDNYSKWTQYSNSKLANILFTLELARRLQGAYSSLWWMSSPQLLIMHEPWLTNPLWFLFPKDTGVNVYSLHPGVITTELGRYLPTWLVCIVGLFQCFLKTPIEGKFLGWWWASDFERRNKENATALLDHQFSGAQTTIHCAVSEEAANETGLYYSDCRPVEPMIPQAKDVQLAEKLWLLSEKLVKEHA